MLKTSKNELKTYIDDKNLVGCCAEYIFATRCMQQGYLVSMPLLQTSKYDCILDVNKKLLKIQIKSIGVNRRRDKGKNSVQIVLARTQDFYNREDVDYFAIYHRELDGFFIIKNNQQRSIRININRKYKENFNNFALFLH